MYAACDDGVKALANTVVLNYIYQHTESGMGVDLYTRCASFFIYKRPFRV